MLLPIMILVLALVLLLSPVVLYLREGWASKRHDLLSYFTEETAREYFDQFPPSFEVAEGEACAALERIYDKAMGRKQFYIPLVILFIIASIEIWAMTGTGLHRLGYVPFPAGHTLPDIALAAIAGAYMWIASDFIVQVQRKNLVPSDLYMASLRFAIAMPMGYAFASVAAKDVGPFIAFAIGAFPLGPLMVILRRLTMKQLGIEDAGSEASDQITCLQGINKDIAERMGQSDLFTVSQLSVTDPVLLTQRTNLGFNFVLDCIGQALAWNYLGTKLNTLRPMGLRGSHEICNFIYSLDHGNTDEKQKAQATLQDFAKAVELPAQTLEHTFREIAEDPYAIFIHEVFH